MSVFQKRILLCTFIGMICFVAAAAFVGPARVARTIKTVLLPVQVDSVVDDKVGLPLGAKVLLIQNNQTVKKQSFAPENDNRRVYQTKDITRLISYPTGYLVDLPPDYTFDFSQGALYVKGSNEHSEVTISKELSPYDDVNEYIRYYLNRFVLSEPFREQNNISLIENENDGSIWRISIVLNDPGEVTKNAYTYVTVQTKGRDFYRMMFKYSPSDQAMPKQIDRAVESLTLFEPVGTAKNHVSYKPRPNKHWSEATKALYDDLKESEQVKWGIFVKDVKEEGIDHTIPQLEERLNYKFPIILGYVHFNEPFPAGFFKKSEEQGRLVELTCQVTDCNNTDLFGYTPQLDIYRGKCDDRIRALARELAQTKQPFFFRLNNEMNSDWTSYSGVVNLSDPDIYISNWRRFYRIFDQEGVHNAIWVYNPNDRNYPPCTFNHSLAYFPGEEFTHLLGITGYNTGTYYAEKWAEEWREFDDIYAEIEAGYAPAFGDYPWMITEFSSSSIGGDKVAWIDNMFKALPKYKRIKAAVWFGYADYDPEHPSTVSRPYWLDETPQTLQAFKKGLHKR